MGLEIVEASRGVSRGLGKSGEVRREKRGGPDRREDGLTRGCLEGRTAECNLQDGKNSLHHQTRHNHLLSWRRVRQMSRADDVVVCCLVVMEF